MSTTSAKFVVRCDDYAVECNSREQAERRLEAIERFGACQLEHTIEECSAA